MSAKASEDTCKVPGDPVQIEYGDQFRHVITGDTRTVHSVTDEKVTWVEGGWDHRDDLVAAINDEQSLYEVEARGDGVYEGDGYGGGE